MGETVSDESLELVFPSHTGGELFDVVEDMDLSLGTALLGPLACRDSFGSAVHQAYFDKTRDPLTSATREKQSPRANPNGGRFSLRNREIAIAVIDFAKIVQENNSWSSSDPEKVFSRTINERVTPLVHDGSFTKKEIEKMAAWVCGKCVSREACFDMALEITRERDVGVLGGFTAEQIRALRRTPQFKSSAARKIGKNGELNSGNPNRQISISQRQRRKKMTDEYAKRSRQLDKDGGLHEDHPLIQVINQSEV